MIKFVKVILVAVLIVLSNCINGQVVFSVNKTSGLKVGDKVPDYEFSNVLNYEPGKLKLSDFSNKLVFLDFWSTSCASCVASWPHLLELQKEFADKIQIVLVNPYQSKEVVQQTFDRRKKLANIEMTLPAVYSDTAILKLFPVSGLPHIVWIDPKGIIRSITSSSASINSKNINALLNNDKVSIPQKISNADLIPAIFDKPLFLDGNGGKAREVYGYSFFGKGDEKLFPTYGLVSNDERKEYYIVLTNFNIRDFYTLAYSNRTTHLGLEMPLANRVIFQVADSSKYVDVINGEVVRDNWYVYQLVSPPASVEELQELMRGDLKRYFGLEAKWVKMKKKCLVLTADDTARIVYKSGPRRNAISEELINLNMVTIKYFIDSMESGTNYYWSPYPIIDETNFKGLLGDIKFETNVSDPVQLDKALQNYGMHLKFEDRMVDILLITDGKTKGSFTP